ncbi:MAG: heme lyase CcmF/NrfE family subunit [Gammaproteobacteria bacterium]
MQPEFGYYALILALCLALCQSTIPLLGAAQHRLAWMQLARSTSYGQLLLIGFAFFSLAYAFISNDFSLTYVAANSNRHLPLIYRFCAVWGAHEGSLLLWVFILSLWTAAVSYFSRSLPLAMSARILAILGMISVGFLLFILTTSNPFLRLLPNVPADGQDLNPLLQDPGLAIHPPMLYMGYVGFSVAFAFALAALLTGRLDAVWARWSRPWTLIAWCFLTIGITLGSWWAYRELGWGGWWFWDPVENAAFLPWLAGTALVHALIVTEKRQAFKAWTVLLAISAFSLSLLGTFLVRSGVLVSVHAFAVDPTRGAFMLVFLALVVGGSLALYAWRAQAVQSFGEWQIFSRETGLLLNNVFLTVAAATVLLGTLYPLIIQTLGLGKISVGAPYFNLVFTPLILPLLLLMGIVPSCHWRQMSLRLLWQKVRVIALFTFIMTGLLCAIGLTAIRWYVVIGVGLAIWISATTLQTLWVRRSLSRTQWGMVVAHLGVAVCVAGIVLTSAYSVERDVRMSIGDQTTAGPYQFQLLGVQPLTGPNYTALQADLTVIHRGREIAQLHPQQRLYTASQTGLAKAAIDAGVWRDLYVALGEPMSNNSWALRIYYKPFVRWIWAGGVLMLLGGLLAISDRRYRLKFFRNSAVPH